jgi:hypothetical protein
MRKRFRNASNSRFMPYLVLHAERGKLPTPFPAERAKAAALGTPG